MATLLSDLTRNDLMRLAREHDVVGRSGMTKAELVEALGGLGVAPDDDAEPPAFTRVGAFRDLARQRAAGAMVFLPRHLRGQERRRHVRQTIREDHETRIASRNAEAQAKFEKLYGSCFSFFRGTALLFYRDMAGEDAEMPTVLTLGDVHPENFGVMPSHDNVPIFGVNDFDEAYYAPFTWDLKRGAVGFILAADEEGGLGATRQRAIASAFVEGYLEAIRTYATDATEQVGQVRQDNAPKIVRRLIEGALEDREHWLARKYADEFRRGFRADEEHVPITSRVPQFQEIIDRFVAESGLDVPERAAGMRVKDVCERHGQGTASLGLPRYYVMIEGPLRDGTDDVLLELKQARRSALAGLVPPSDYEFDGTADRISHAQGVHLVRGDRFYGAVDLDGLSFMVRERAPYRDSIDLGGLSKKRWRTYARVCGASLAQSHALSDEAGRVDHDIEPDILASIGAEELFVDDILAFAIESAERVRRDHAHFRTDHEMGAFRTVDRFYR